MIKNPTIGQDVWFVDCNKLNKGFINDLYTSGHVSVTDHNEYLDSITLSHEKIFATKKKAIAYWEKDILLRINNLMASKLYDSVNDKSIKFKLKKF